MRKALVALAMTVLLATAAGAQATKDTLRIGMGLEPPGLDPTAEAAAAVDEVVYANLFEGLTRIDETGAVLPALAESWAISEDGLTYSFTLRQGVTFHDGSAMDSADVKFTLERIVAEDSTNAQKALYAGIESVETSDPQTVVVRIKNPDGKFLWKLGWGDAVIVSSETAATNKTEPVGTGPYRFKRWNQGDRVELVAYDAYWGEKPKIPNVTFTFIPDAPAQVAAMLAGDLDAFPNIGAPEVLEQFKADPRFEVVVGNTEGETILVMNGRRDLFKDPRVRQAISHAIDRQAIIDGAMFGYGAPIGTHFAPHHPFYVGDPDLYAYDTARAKDLLSDAGHGDGLKLVMKLPPPSYARRGGEIIAAQLQAIGIEVEQVPVEWAQWLKEVFRGEHDFDLTIVSHTEPLDIGIYARDEYYFGYKSDAFKDVITELEVTADPAMQKALYAKAQDIIADDAVNVYLFQLAKIGVVTKGLKGMWANSPVQANDVTGAYWE